MKRISLSFFHGAASVMIAVACAAMILLVACAGSPAKSPSVVSYFGVNSDGRLFLDSLFGIVDSTERYWINTESTSAECMLLSAQEDFNGDGLTDALLTNVQACGGNAIGNAFFFATYAGDGRFAVSNSFGSNVFDDPVIEAWEGMKSVVINESSYDEWTSEYSNHRERYVLVDTFALRAESPEDITPMPTLPLEEWRKLEEMEDMGEEAVMSDEDSLKYVGCAIYDDLYSGHCSWYCGGEVQRITASSCREDADSTFDAGHSHDFSHETVWAPSGQGLGESLVYHFAGSCPRITTVKILNGYVKSADEWQDFSRVKMIRMYINDRPYALLSLQDSRSLQCFDVGIVGFHDAEAPDWTLRFEIMEVYPGKRHEAPVISELYFDGIDVH